MFFDYFALLIDVFMQPAFALRLFLVRLLQKCQYVLS
jgi:hypothetical protein